MRLPLFLFQFILLTIISAAQSSSTESKEQECSATNNESPLQHEVSKCTDVECIATAIATSQSFFDDYFEQKSLLLHVDPSALQDIKMDWNDVVELATKGLTWGSSTNGLRLASGSGEFISSAKVGGQAFDKSSIEDMPVLRSQLEGPSAITGSTLQIGAIHTLDSGAADVVRQFQRIFGHVANGNLYVSSPGLDTVAHMHTDRMDGYAIQLSGRKRWQVYAPIPVAHNPIWGVMGNAEWGKETGKSIPSDLVGEKLIDVVLEPGDILYVPRGFPHTTSTLMSAEKEGEPNSGPSISFTVAVHTEAHHLVYEKLLRCTFARAGYCEQSIPSSKGKYCPIGLTLTNYARSKKGRPLRDSLPVGFLNEGGDWFSFVRALAHKAERLMKSVLDMAEEKGVVGIEHLLDDTEKLDKELVNVAGRVFHIQSQVLEALEETFAGSKKGNNTPFAERQKHWAQLFGRIGAFTGNFCHEGGSNVLFMDYFSPELEEDVLTKRIR